MKRPSKSKAIDILTELKDQIETLKDQSIESGEFKVWRHYTRTSIRNIFGENSDNLKRFRQISYFPKTPKAMVIGGIRYLDPGPSSDYRKKVVFTKGLQEAKWMLSSMIKEIDNYWPDSRDEKNQTDVTSDKSIDSDRVFVVHGRDEGAKHSVARFVEQLGLEPIILEEQPSKGRTIISKFLEESTDIGFAIILLTPDDEGKQRGSEDELKPRARQNVVLELGFFLAFLGQERVCALTKGGVEIPSDYDGVIYIPLNDSNDWKFRLVHELSAAGFNVDANRILNRNS